MTALAFVLLAGVGALVRAAATGLEPSLQRKLIAILIVNVAGSFLLGLAAGADMDVPVAVGVGGLGALTTFSAFVELVDRVAHEIGLRHAAYYSAATLAAGIAAAWLGSSGIFAS